VAQNELCYEVQVCRNVLEQRLGHALTSFAYSNRAMAAYRYGALHVVQQAGYRWALTTNYGINTLRDYPFQLKRIESDVTQHWLVVAARLLACGDFLRVYVASICASVSDQSIQLEVITRPMAGQSVSYADTPALLLCIMGRRNAGNKVAVE